MEKINAGRFYAKLLHKKKQYPLSGQLELTYSCNLNCLHCFCLGQAGKNKELTTLRWKKILDELKNEGCLFLTFTGGDPLARKDFLEIYAYARKKGFITTIFTNGLGFNQKIISALLKSPPFCIEITLNGITKKTYEEITRREGSFQKVSQNILALAKAGLKIILKANCLTTNKDEIVQIKRWTEDLLGRPAAGRYRFKYDPMIFPRLNGEKAPLEFRLPLRELAALRRQDIDIWQEHCRGQESDLAQLSRDKKFLYQCNSWMRQFFINPYGRLKFCYFSDKFSTDLKNVSFHRGFYEVFPRLLDEKFKTDSACRNCNLRPACYHCPPRAFLETGNEEAPVKYYCALARESVKPQ